MRPQITIHSAASLADVVQELGDLYSARAEITVHYNIAGSGALAQQIIAAPRGDLFLSANYNWLKATVESGSIGAASVRQIATNQLAVIAPAGSDYNLQTLDDLCDMEINHLCIGDPAHVPAGAYAKAWLERISCDSESTWDKLKDKVLPAIDVRAAMAQSLAQQDSVAIVYNTDYLLRREELQRLYLVPAEDAPAIAYYAGILTESSQPENAQAFLDYLASPEAQSIIERYGFGIPTHTKSRSQVVAPTP
jgi:molybdate transport system substrate-binding protein